MWPEDGPTSASVRSTVSHWVEEFERWWWEGKDRSDLAKRTTWKKEFQDVFNKLPANRGLSVDLLVKVAQLNSKPNTRSRKRFSDSYRRLAEFAGLPSEAILELRGNYSPTKVDPRNIPSDETFLEWWDEMPTREWAFAYGLSLCFGLRPSEIWRCDYSDLLVGDHTIAVLEKTKTGERKVWPICPDEWLEKLRKFGPDVPAIKLDRENRDISNTYTQRLRRLRCPFTPYDLRHAYAIRGILYGVENALAANWCGHSLVVHCNLYQKWIQDNHSEQGYQQMMKRRD